MTPAFDTLIARGVRDAEQWQARRRTRLVRRLMAGILIVLLVAGLAAGLALNARSIRQRGRLTAECREQATLLAERTAEYHGKADLPTVRIDCAADPQAGLLQAREGLDRLNAARH
jgi:hypothetical protein